MKLKRIQFALDDCAGSNCCLQIHHQVSTPSRFKIALCARFVRVHAWLNKRSSSYVSELHDKVAIFPVHVCSTSHLFKIRNSSFVSVHASFLFTLVGIHACSFRFVLFGFSLAQRAGFKTFTIACI